MSNDQPMANSELPSIYHKFTQPQPQRQRPGLCNAQPYCCPCKHIRGREAGSGCSAAQYSCSHTPLPSLPTTATGCTTASAKL